MINNTVSNPSSLNNWLQHNDGYVCVDGDCDNLNLPDVHKLDDRIALVKFETVFNLTDIVTWIEKGSFNLTLQPSSLQRLGSNHSRAKQVSLCSCYGLFCGSPQST